ncbi:hypothetical protein ACFO3J_35470 [Streptomyces polygonati]|uniref:Uncharacterized protein n=1 Tax=Streptomyces polygonati TaxID=1617087 RepID=A0ABV8I0H6_9ACTN
MSAQTITRRFTAPADAPERAAVDALITEPEASISGAPAYSPQASVLLLLLLLLSPKEPAEPREK